jgi:hypothetical protein
VSTTTLVWTLWGGLAAYWIGVACFTVYALSATPSWSDAGRHRLSKSWGREVSRVQYARLLLFCAAAYLLTGLYLPALAIRVLSRPH